VAATPWPKRALDRALFVGARTGNTGMLEPLLSYGADATYREVDEYNRTVLMSAASSGVPQMVSAFISPLSAGLEDNVNAQDQEGKTALILNASAYRSEDGEPVGIDRAAVVDLLLKAGAKVDQRDNDGNTALMADHSLADVATALIKAGANVNAQNN